MKFYQIFYQGHHGQILRPKNTKINVSSTNCSFLHHGLLLLLISDACSPHNTT